jgi:hypothetical protein
MSDAEAMNSALEGALDDWESEGGEELEEPDALSEDKIEELKKDAGL